MVKGKDTRMAERLEEGLGGELRDHWEESDGQHESVEEKVRRLTRRIERLERVRKREVDVDGIVVRE